MKKIKLLLLALTLILVCFCAASCSDDDPKGQGGELLDFEGLVFEDKEVVYDGTPHTVTLKGHPVTADVKYSDNSTQTDVGVYEITVTVSKSGYNTKTLTARLTVKKATYDMSGVTFDGKTVPYTGEDYDLAISGKLPDGVGVTYVGNGVSSIGEHTVTAKFTVADTKNYEPISDMTATLKISDDIVPDVEFDDMEFVYDGEPKSIYVRGDLPEGVEVEYVGNNVTNAGEYTVTAKFKVGDRYLDFEKTAKITVKKATYDMSHISFKDKTFIYDGNGHSIAISGKLPDGVSVTYIGNGAKEIGKHTVTAKFSGDAENYEAIPDMTAVITVAEYDTNKTVYVQLVLESADSATVKSGKLKLGSSFVLTAGDTARNFAGWSLGYALDKGGELLSTERVFTLEMLPSVIGDTNMITVYSNYIDKNTVKYDPNGGNVNTDSTNMKGNAYYSAEYDGKTVSVKLSDKYMSFAESASSFWDDGTFSREGYVLIEYNTMPDGSGESYSLGSKFYAASTASQTLYCIWAKATQASDFEYEDVHWGYADGVTEATAPSWKQDGIKITKYNGNSEWVVIPEMIDGKYVTTIDKDAFIDKQVKVLVFNRFILRVEDGAFQNCSELTTLYMNDSIFYMNDAAFDKASYTSFKNFYLNATMAPRFMKNSHGDGGVFSVKLSRLLASQDKNRIIVVSGSSTYQGLGSAYLEGLLDGEYTVINLGTTRTGTGLIFFEALQHYTHEGDIVIFAPENHVNMFGQNTMWYRSFYDLEGMYNLYRYIDISHYPSVFSAFSAYNRERRYKNAPTAYEDIAGDGIRSDKYGDFQQDARNSYCEESSTKYIDSYFITLNKYYKNDLLWNDIPYQTEHKDYLTSETWEDITKYKDEVNRAIKLLQATGAKVYFGFAPVDADSVIEEAQSREWMEAYDAMLLENYCFDGLLGSSADYVFAHKYFFDCAYHVNNYGRTYRTYQIYLDICKLLGRDSVKDIDGAGKDFAGCLFEDGAVSGPVTKVDYLQK